MLKDMGYSDNDVDEAIKKCGVNAQRCVEFCLRKQTSVTNATSAGDPALQDDWAFDLIRELGFHADNVTEALEATDYSLQEALMILLNGNDSVRNKYRGTNSFRRQTNKTTVSLKLEKCANDDVCEQYRVRAIDYFQRDVRVHDLGIYAGNTVNACFWLTLAAGLAKSSWQINSQALPGLADSIDLLQKTRDTELPSQKHVCSSPLGLFAQKLRHYMCAGATAVLLRHDMQAKLFPAFAALDTASESRTLQHYKQWVARLADKEFADELVLVAVVLELKIRIVTIPYTPSDSASQWKINTYGPEKQEGITEIIFGNNDVHYMWIMIE